MEVVMHEYTSERSSETNCDRLSRCRTRGLRAVQPKMDAGMVLCAPPASPAEVDSTMDTVVKKEQVDEPTPAPTKRQAKKKGLRKKFTRKASQVKQEPVDARDGEPTPREPPSKKRKRASVAPTPYNVRTDTYQEDYDEQWYDEAGWEQWWPETETNSQWQQGEEDNYPYGLWNLIYEDVKLEEDPNLIHEVCVMLQEKQIVSPWQLKQTSREFLEKDSLWKLSRAIWWEFYTSRR